MPQRIEVPGMGIVEFPDGMSDDQIAAAIQQNMGQPQAQPQAQPQISGADYATDIAKSGGSGVMSGIASMIGTGGDINKAVRGLSSGLQQQGMPVEQSRQEMLATMPGFLRRFHEQPAPDIGTSEVSGAIDRVAGAPVTTYQPQTTPGKYAKTVGQFVPAAALTGGVGPANLAAGAVLPGIASEGAGQIAQSYAPKLETPARIAGALVGGAVGSGARYASQKSAVEASTPSVGDMKKAASARYGAVDVEISPSAVAARAADIEAELAKKGFTPRNAPETFDVLAQLKKAGAPAASAEPAAAAAPAYTHMPGSSAAGGASFSMPGAMPAPGISPDIQRINAVISNLKGQAAPPPRAAPAAQPSPLPQAAGPAMSGTQFEGWRQELVQATRNFANPRDQAAAGKVIEKLDDYLANIQPSDVVRGDAAAAAKNFSEARQLWGTAKRAELVNSKLDVAELRASAANSGRNIDNAIRQRMVDILASPRLSKGFSAEELAQMRKIAEGTNIGNVLRVIGNAAGGGGGIGSVLSAGAGAAAGSFAGPAGAGIGAIAAPALGVTAKSAGNALTRRAAEALVRDISNRSPIGSNAAITVSPTKDAIIRALIAARAGQDRQQQISGP